MLGWRWHCFEPGRLQQCLHLVLGVAVFRWHCLWLQKSVLLCLGTTVFRWITYTVPKVNCKLLGRGELYRLLIIEKLVIDGCVRTCVHLQQQLLFSSGSWQPLGSPVEAASGRYS